MCDDYESLGHIVQTCARTWKVRNDRHDAVAKKVCEKLIELGYETREEPRIPTKVGIWKPDIVAWLPGSSAFVLDVTVVSDGAELDKCHELKKRYYDTEEIRAWVANKADVQPDCVSCSAVTFNWRGALAKPSAVSLLQLGINRSDLKLLSVIVLQQTFAIYMFSRRHTGGKSSSENDTSSMWRPTHRGPLRWFGRNGRESS